MATIFAPQYRDPNAEFKQMLLQFASMVGQGRKDDKLAGQRQGDIQSLAQYGENIGEFQDYQSQTRNELSGVLSAQPGNRLPELAKVMQGGRFTDPDQFNTRDPERPQFPNLQSPEIQQMASQLMLNRAFSQPKQGRQFTLGPGQTRFDPTGKPIATVRKNAPSAKKTPEENLKYWQKIFNDTQDTLEGTRAGQEKIAGEAKRQIRKTLDTFKPDRDLARNINRATKFPDTMAQLWSKTVKAKGGSDADVAKLLQIFQSGNKEDIEKALRRLNGNVR